MQALNAKTYTLVYAGSSLKNRGFEIIMNDLWKYLPNPSNKN